MIKIGIHERIGSFSDKWIEFCVENHVPYKIVNCYNNDIIEQLEDCDALMWHHHHDIYKDILLANKLLFSLQQSGKIVFPNIWTTWHYDDKLGQKYLFEAVNAPAIPTYIFYSKSEAISWANGTDFPKVFKLRNGAGSVNVKLINDKKSAIKLINKAFKKGFSPVNKFGRFKEHLRKIKLGRESFFKLAKDKNKRAKLTEVSKMKSREKGYVYFQDFMPDNPFDIRVTVIGNKAFAIKRLTRENDFRASGSGLLVYDKNEIDTNCIKTAFDVNEKLKMQCVSFDFIYDKNKNPKIVEISYAFPVKGFVPAKGYWDKNLNWHDDEINFQAWMVEGIIEEIKASKNSQAL